MKRTISLVKFLFFILDVCFFFVSLVLVLYLRFGDNFLNELINHLPSFIFLLPFYLIFLIAFGFYDIYPMNLRIIFLSLINFSLFFLIFSSFFFYFGQVFFSIGPKTNLFIFNLVLSIFVFLLRLISIKLKGKTNIYFKGPEYLKNKLKHDLSGSQYFIFYENFNPKTVKENSILVISGNHSFNNDYLEFLISKHLTTFDFVSFYEKFFGRIPLEAIDFNWLVKELVQSESDIYFYLKRFLDILIALILLPIFIISLPIISLLIFLNSPGPIFFIQKRIGGGDKEFDLIKFRTMYVSQEKQQWAVGEEKNRIFFIGKILRKSHFDELPQIINLLRGDISIVGPRPEQPMISQKLEKEIPFYRLRTLIKPGITGWAQVNYKYPETIEETKIKLEFDLFYIKNHNLFLDLLIVIKTFQKLLF